MAMGPNPVPPVNIPVPTKIVSKMGGAPTSKWDPAIGVDNHSQITNGPCPVPQKLQGFLMPRLGRRGGLCRHLKRNAQTAAGAETEQDLWLF